MKSNSQSDPHNRKGSKNTTLKYGDFKVSGNASANTIGTIKNAFFGSPPWKQGKSSKSLAKRDAVSLYRIDPLSWATTLSRISDDDPRRQQKRLARQRVEGTAEWVKDNPAIQEWTTSPFGSILWFTGTIGCGKSVTCSYLIDCLEASAPTSDRPIIFNFVGSSSHDEDLSRSLLQSLLQQALTVLTRLDICPAEMRINITKFFGPSATAAADVDELQELLLAAFAFLPPGVSIIDGLDEIHTSSIPGLLQFFYQLQRQCPEEKILISSRKDLGFNVRVDCNLEVSPSQISTSHDLSKYVDITIETMTRQKRRLTEDGAVMELVKQRLLAQAEGMFLWVKLQLQALWTECLSEEAESILKTLDNLLLDDLHSIYARCLLRIPKPLVELAAKAFRWIACSVRPLTIDECQEVLALRTDIAWDGSMRLSKDVILSACTNLVNMDPEDRTLQFVHASVRTYLLSTHYLPTSIGMNPAYDADCWKRLCAEECLHYLSFPGFKRSSNTQITKSKASLPSPSSLGTAVASSILPQKVFHLLPLTKRHAPMVELPSLRVETRANLKLSFAFLEYARTHWVAHTRLRSTDFGQSLEMLSTLATDPVLPFEFYPWATNDHTTFDHRLGLLRYAVSTTHDALLRCIVGKRPTAEFQKMCSARLSEEGFTALHLAVIAGGAGSNGEGMFSPLVVGTSSNNINITDDNGWTPLHHAVARQNVSAVNILLHSPGIRLDQMTDDGHSVLSLCTALGNEDRITQLLSAGAKHREPCMLHPVIIASTHGFYGVLRRLTSQRPTAVPGLEVEGRFTGDIGGTSILLEAAAQAAMSNQISVLDILLAADSKERIKPSAFRPYGMVYITATQGHIDFLSLLCDRGFIQQVTQDRFDEFELMLRKVASSGSTAILEKLCEQEAIVSFLASSPDMSWQLGRSAVKHDDVAALEALTKHFKLTSLASEIEVQSLLNFAAQLGSVGCVSYLLTQPGVEPIRLNVMGVAALHEAIKTDSIDVVSYILGVTEINMRVWDMQLALDVAVQRDRHACLDLLLQHARYQLNIFKALAISYTRYHYDAVALLLNHMTRHSAELAAELALCAELFWLREEVKGEQNLESVFRDRERYLSRVGEWRDAVLSSPRNSEEVFQSIVWKDALGTSILDTRKTIAETYIQSDKLDKAARLTAQHTQALIDEVVDHFEARSKGD